MMNPAINPVMTGALAANNAALAARNHGGGPRSPEEAGTMLLVCGAIIVYTIWVTWLSLETDTLSILGIGITIPFFGFGLAGIGYPIIGGFLMSLWLIFLGRRTYNYFFPRYHRL